VDKVVVGEFSRFGKSGNPAIGHAVPVDKQRSTPMKYVC
jgi:hypothetical protein